MASSKMEEADHGGSGSNWYFTREEIELHSPSREDNINLKEEIYFCESYCTFLQDLGKSLKVPQVTIATAIVFCHRFFLRQSHLKNDGLAVATVCMFLAAKVEDTRRGLVDVIRVSYKMRFEKDSAAMERMKTKPDEVIEEQKKFMVVGEHLVLRTLGFDFNIDHPYKPLVAAIKKFKEEGAQLDYDALAQVSWKFVTDGLRTTLCLQFKPHHIAAGAIFLATKFLKVELPEKVPYWPKAFGDVTRRHLEEVAEQMLELYKQNKVGDIVTASFVAGSGSKSDPSISVDNITKTRPATALIHDCHRIRHKVQEDGAGPATSGMDTKRGGQELEYGEINIPTTSAQEPSRSAVPRPAEQIRRTSMTTSVERSDTRWKSSRDVEPHMYRERDGGSRDTKSGSGGTNTYRDGGHNRPRNVDKHYHHSNSYPLPRYRQEELDREQQYHLHPRDRDREWDHMYRKHPRSDSNWDPQRDHKMHPGADRDREPERDHRKHPRSDSNWDPERDHKMYPRDRNQEQDHKRPRHS